MKQWWQNSSHSTEHTVYSECSFPRRTLQIIKVWVTTEANFYWTFSLCHALVKCITHACIILCLNFYEVRTGTSPTSLMKAQYREVKPHTTDKKTVSRQAGFQPKSGLGKLQVLAIISHFPSATVHGWEGQKTNVFALAQIILTPRSHSELTFKYRQINTWFLLSVVVNVLESCHEHWIEY